MPKVLIVGGGKGGTALLPILDEYPEIEVEGMVDPRPDAPGLKLAQELGIPTSGNYRELLAEIEVDIIIDVAGNLDVTNDLATLRKPGKLEVIEGSSAQILFKLVDERRSREEDALNRLKEQEALYKIGIMLTSSESEEELLGTILDCATRLTHTPAGSVALYDESGGFMELMASQGLGDRFVEGMRWKVRDGGLTEYILNQINAVVIPDVSKRPEISSPELEAEGVKAIMAIPLIAERKTKGILYVDDFEPREFTKKDESILALLSTQAAIAIEKMQLFEKVKRLAITDGLTGLFNHRHFVKVLKEELKRSRRYEHECSVILIDVDHFKHYNDTNGHLRGNEVLKRVTEVMASVLRKIDVIARYGGEEFSVILPETDRSHALLTAERICRAVEAEDFVGGENQPFKRLTVSAGVATFPMDAKRQIALLDRADSALYRAKREGRNRAVGYQE